MELERKAGFDFNVTLHDYPFIALEDIPSTILLLKNMYKMMIGTILIIKVAPIGPNLFDTGL